MAATKPEKIVSDIGKQLAQQTRPSKDFLLKLLRIEYDPRMIGFRQLLEIFWSSHDSRQVFGQGPDVGNQYRSIVFTNGTSESRLAAISKEQEQAKAKTSIVTTQIQPLETFLPSEPEHQKFELKRNPFLLHLIGNLPEEELEGSALASKMNSYEAELCPPRIQKHIDAKINEIIRKGPVFAHLSETDGQVWKTAAFAAFCIWARHSLCFFGGIVLDEGTWVDERFQSLLGPHWPFGKRPLPSLFLPNTHY